MSLKNVIGGFTGDAGEVWTERSLGRSRRLLGVGYAFCIACLSLGANLSVEAYNAPAYNVSKEDPKLTDLASKLADVHFDLDKTDLGQDAIDKITADATSIREVLKYFPRVHFLLEGFCDDRGTSEYNVLLGYKRAEATRNALIADGIDESKLEVASHGKASPLCDDGNEPCRQRNRRVHLAAVE
jgi:peptidoglycan-associated lipoprotein